MGMEDASLHASMLFQTSAFLLKKAKIESYVSQFLAVVVVKETPQDQTLQMWRWANFQSRHLDVEGSDVIQLATCEFKSLRRDLG